MGEHGRHSNMEAMRPPTVLPVGGAASHPAPRALA